ncbi:GNAT family N-acetyltransferase [Paenarthrobacter aurescens]|uniref:N-acetyltransferase domain-containing protein n=1 Tax=Paenarthrobacter aurescens TaxID=43663 RepID=A0A4Y3NKD3_PAEAU|nr:GNAT family N-acetyltransferase [Paenarthrobacter aurescens]UKA50233.1 N-acetyltransferase [Arthrobacter sp. FW305-123]MDO6141966.1 N-acetyltransferase [Paenarthrobacter aurescens]MDO6145771.1 N-acetyltransferase [Paenarthrobacter aurescens]MDO6157015.1 N-acetyltransferase [Paenarthrobacter aurescens]MDO6161001.1 N-acetyltransferase [Paenarthrobacter aurescens]
MTEYTDSLAESFRPGVTTVRNDKFHRYELHVDGELAVISQFMDKPGHIDFIHTETKPGFEGQGLAQVLAHFALDDVVASGKRIIPHCPYIAAYLKKHEGYEQDVDWPAERPVGQANND